MENLSVSYICFQDFECFSPQFLPEFVFFPFVLSYTPECPSKIISEFNTVLYFSFCSFSNEACWTAELLAVF